MAHPLPGGQRSRQGQDTKYSSKYLIAIQLVNKQRALLEEILEIRPDKAVEQDIELLKQYYEILYKQAKVLNLIQ